MSVTSYIHNRVLIADDDPTIRQVMRVALQKNGFQVLEAADGQAAIDSYIKHKPGLVLLDVEMPVKNGFEACAEIRALPDGDKVPIMIATGREDIDAVDEAYDIGATDFIAKPINWQIFGHRIRYVLRASAQNKALVTTETKNDVLIGAMPDTMLVLRKDGHIVEYLPGKEETYRKSLEADKRNISDHLPPWIAKRWYEALERVIDQGKNDSCEYELVNPEGNRLYFQTRFVPYVDDLALAIATEYTQRKKAEEKVYKLAYFDTLTGLPNRQFFREQLASMIKKAEADRCAVAVLYIDLDNFKRINDHLGHSYGDGVLKSVAERLSGCIRKQDPLGDERSEPVGIARLGGDEFACALSGFSDEAILNTVAERIRNTLREPVNYRGHEFVVTPSVGVAVYPHDGDDVEDLLKNADVAMYQAKDAGRNSIRFYSGTMSIRSMQRLEIEANLRRAIENEELELHYQPKVELATGRTIGVEALVRWRDNEGNYISPAQFIPIAEDSGLVTPLGDWVLREACRQIRRWKTSLGINIQVAVNISGAQFYQSDLRKTVMQALFEASVRPDLLQLELTESTLMSDVPDTIDTLNELKGAGVGLAVDDFGTGYSSLAYLKRFPLDLLKIDQSFVSELEGNNDDSAICAAIIAMAHQLGLSVVAEGIETDEQLRFLRDQGCEVGQGYLLGKPMPAEQIERAVSRGRQRDGRTSSAI